jgi:tape measure domain-containing protein
MPNSRFNVLMAFEGEDSGLKRALQSAQRSLDGLASTAKSASAKAQEGFALLKNGVDSLGDHIARAKTQFLAFVGISWAKDKALQVIEVADSWNLMIARLKLATAGQREFIAAQSQIFSIAQQLGVPISEATTLYGKLQLAVRQLGGEQKTAFKLTEAISQALKISGASAQEAQSALLQFGQGLAGTALRGQEFNATVEAAPRLAQALADGLNVPIGRLKKMADQGQLTADIVINALLSQKDKLAAEYAQLPLTVGTSFQRLSNAFAQWIAKVDESTGLTQKLAAALDWLARNLDSVMRWLKLIAEIGLGVLIYRLIPALITAWQLAGTAAVTAAAATSAAWATVNMTLSAAIATAGQLKTAFAVLAAAVVGWEVGSWLSEKFEIVRQAGVLMVQVLEGEFEKLRFSWELLSAVFSGDTLAAATARHQQRLQQMQSIFASMYGDATDASQAAQSAITATAAAAEEMTKRLEAVRQGTQEAVGRGLEALDGALDKLKAQLNAVEQAAAQANQRATEAIAGISAAYQSLSSIVESGLQQQLAATTAYYTEQQAALAQSHASQRDLIVRTTQLNVDALAKQSELRAQALAETLRLIDQEGQARLYAAQRQAETEEARRAASLRIDNEILAAKQQTLSQALAEYTRHIDALNAEANRHLAEIRRIEDEKRALSQSTEDKIRDLQRSAMTEYQQYQDKLTQVAELQQKARTALSQGEFEQAVAFAKQAQDLAAQTAKAVKSGDETIISQKQAVKTAIDAIRSSEALAIEALEGEGRAHQQAAEQAKSARSDIDAALRSTANQIEQLKTQLQAGLKLSIDVDSAKLDDAFKTLDASLREKTYLLRIEADLTAAQTQVRALETQLKDGKTLLVDADTTRAKTALDTLARYADQQGHMELKLATEKAQAALRLVQGQIRAMDQIRSESQHVVRSNVPQARAEIQSLNGQNTSSTHTVYVKKVEQHASGGMVGMSLPRFARGGSVGSTLPLPFPALTQGSVPGRGDGDTVPRTLDAGAFVLRKAAVRRYGVDTVAKLSRLARFASGGAVGVRGQPVRLGPSRTGGLGLAAMGGVTAAPPQDRTISSAPNENNQPPLFKKNREVTEALKLVELGLVGIAHYASALNRNSDVAVEPGIVERTMYPLRLRAAFDRKNLEPLLRQASLSSVQSSVVAASKEHWMMALKTGLMGGVDLERELMAYMERETKAQAFFARGGMASLAASDTVPAMLTPGEFVVNRATVQRLGVGFFSALNQLALPKAAVLARVQGFAQGGLVRAPEAWAGVLRGVPRDLDALAPPLARPLSSVRAAFETAPTKSIRVELVSGSRSVMASIPARDESQLLALLREAQSRS